MRGFAKFVAAAIPVALPTYARAEVPEEATYGRFLEVCGAGKWHWATIDEVWLGAPMPTGNRCGEAVYGAFNEALRGRLNEQAIAKCAGETSVGTIDMAIEFSPVSTSDLYKRHAFDVLKDAAPYVCGLMEPVPH